MLCIGYSGRGALLRRCFEACGRMFGLSWFLWCRLERYPGVHVLIGVACGVLVCFAWLGGELQGPEC